MPEQPFQVGVMPEAGVPANQARLAGASAFRPPIERLSTEPARGPDRLAGWIIEHSLSPGLSCGQRVGTDSFRLLRPPARVSGASWIPRQSTLPGVYALSRSV